jgi:two-component system cell cycle response regulator
MYRRLSGKAGQMTNIGSLFIVSQDLVRARRLGELFERARYRVGLFAEGNEALSAIRALPPDVVLLGERTGDLGCAALLQRLRADPVTADIPVALDAADAEAWRSGAGLDLPVDDVLPADFDADAMVFRLQPLFRLSTMQAELCLRADDPSLFSRFEAASGNVRALYLSLNPRATLPPDILGGAAIWETATSTAEAEAIITGPGFFDVAVIDAEVRDVDAIISFCRDLRDNPRLFNLPFLVRVAELSPDDARELYRCGVGRVLSGLDTVSTLRHEVEALIRLQLRRNAVRDALRRTLTETTGHPLQAVYTEGFLEPYLEKRLTIARERDRALSVVHLHLPEAASLLEEAGEEACRVLTEQLARWLARLIRVEDLAARVGDSDFAVALPDTLSSEAHYVMNRLAGVLTFTDFAVPDVYRPVKVWPLIGVAGMEPGDTAADILARARANLS